MKNKQILFKIPLLLLAVVVLFSFGANTAAAANTTIYVNTTGNNNWDGQSAIWNGTSGPKQTINNATGTVTANGTIYIAKGTYNENNITINQNMTIIGENQQNTIINGTQSGYSIFIIAQGVNVTISNLTLTQGQSDNGGAIYNDGGTLTVTNSKLTNNTADHHGGAIYNDGGTLTVTNCTLTDNSAAYAGAIANDGNSTVTNSTFIGNTAGGNGGAILNFGGATLTVNNTTFLANSANTNNPEGGSGGAIDNLGTLIVTNSTFTGNSAEYGGAICSGETLKLTSSTLKNNNATRWGGAIYNYGVGNVNFNWILGNTASTGSAIYSTQGTVNATLNWWGSNADPSSNVQGNVTVTPWLILNITVDPNNVLNGGKSIVTVDLLHDSHGVYHDPALGHVPDGIPVNFTGTLGSLNPASTTLVNGQATSIFPATSLGIANITATVDIQPVSAKITVNPVPTGNTTNNNSNTVNAATTTKTIPMQNTGVPMAGFALAILSVLGGILVPRKK